MTDGLDLRRVPWVAVPLALARWHRAVGVGTRIEVRWPASPSPVPLDDLIVGAGCRPSVRPPDIERLRSLADTVGPGMRVLICGLNPSLHAADAGVGFVTANNRFWSAASAAGLMTVDRDPVGALVDDAVGMTDLVKRATPRADELAKDEYRSGLDRLERLSEWLSPGVVCFVGLAGWRATGRPRAKPGVQPDTVGGRPVYVMPSTSGLNAGTSAADLVDHLRAALEVARTGTGTASFSPG